MQDPGVTLFSNFQSYGNLFKHSAPELQESYSDADPLQFAEIISKPSFIGAYRLKRAAL